MIEESELKSNSIIKKINGLINKTDKVDRNIGDDGEYFPHKKIIDYIKYSSNEERLSKMPACWNPWF